MKAIAAFALVLALARAGAAELKDLTLLGFAPGQELSVVLKNPNIAGKSAYVEINSAVSKRLGVRDYGEEPMPLAHFGKLVESVNPIVENGKLCLPSGGRFCPQIIFPDDEPTVLGLPVGRIWIYFQYSVKTKRTVLVDVSISFQRSDLKMTPDEVLLSAITAISDQVGKPNTSWSAQVDWLQDKAQGDGLKLTFDKNRLELSLTHAAASLAMDAEWIEAKDRFDMASRK